MLSGCVGKVARRNPGVRDLPGRGVGCRRQDAVVLSVDEKSQIQRRSTAPSPACRAVAGQEATGGALRQLRCATAMAPRTEVSPAASAAATRWTNAARCSTGSNAEVAISWASSASDGYDGRICCYGGARVVPARRPVRPPSTTGLIGRIHPNVHALRQRRSRWRLRRNRSGRRTGRHRDGSHWCGCAAR
jgi:hypothetical protein